MSSWRKTLQGTAYHEAGHIVVAYVLRIAFAGATIRHDRESGFKGKVFCGKKRPSPTCTLLCTGRRVLDDIDVCLAGPLAQSMFNRRSVRRWQHMGDYSNAMTLVQLIVDEKDWERCFGFIEGQMMRTESLLRRHWAVVGCVADALLEHRTLDRRELVAVIKRARKAASLARHGSQPWKTFESRRLFQIFREQVTGWLPTGVVVHTASASSEVLKSALEAKP